MHEYVHIGLLRFTWDSAKRESNLKKHGFDFVDAERVFSGLTFTLKDDRFEYDGTRFLTLGIVNDTVVVIAHTEESEKIRVLSMRKATRREQEAYFKSIAN